VLVDFLRANADVFAWSPSDMPGIPRDVAEHSLDIRTGARLVKQPLRRFDEEKRRVIGDEIHKLKEAKSVKLNPKSASSPCWGYPGATHPPPKRPLVTTDVPEPRTCKLAGGRGEVYDDAWNIQQLRRFYP
jgi:hypothetical protein